MILLFVSTVLEKKYFCYQKVSFAGSPFLDHPNLLKKHP